LHQSQLTLTIS